ncbi:MAG TPA: PfkB family carbohydrate kinase [Caulobacteraceae bacterium]|jgi:pyridoxine kinase
MAAVLILSSFVAASRVGGSAQAAALERMGVRAILVPTVTFGRHPGLGAPGGGPIDDDIFEGMLTGAEMADGFADLSAVICGYFASPGQVEVAAKALERVRAASPAAPVIVDPIMGDEDTGLYVKEAVANAIAGVLAPAADILIPNAWELARLTGRPVGDLSEARAAARALGGVTLVSSVPLGAEIGVLLSSDGGEFLARHARSPAAPKGTGDLLTGLFAGALTEGISLPEAMMAAVAEVAALTAGEAITVTLDQLDG